MKRKLAAFILFIFAAGMVHAQRMSAPVNISNTEGMSRWGQVAFTSDGIAHFVWEDGYRIVYKSYDGTRYSAPYYLKRSTNVFAAEPYITADSTGRIYVAWMENDTNGDKHGINFMLRQYNPQTRVWLPAEDVAAGILEHEPPAVAVDSLGNIFCAWTDYGHGISNTRCKINGTWGEVTRMNKSGGRGKYTAIASGPDGRIWCVWGEKDGTGNYKTHYSLRTKDTEWSAKKIMNLTPGDQDRPNIAVDPTTNIPHVIYGNIDEVTGTFAGAVIICKIDGITNPLETVIQPKLQHYAKLVIDRNGYKHVAVQTGPGDFGSGIKYTNNVGGKWKVPVQMTNATGYPKLPGLATDGRNVALVWGSLVSDSNKEIWFSSLYPVAVHNLYPPTDLNIDYSFGASGASSKITYGLSWKADARNAASLRSYKIYSRPSSSEPYELVVTVPKTTLQASLSYPRINQNLTFALASVDTDGYESKLQEFPTAFPTAKAPLNMQCVVSTKGLFKNPQVIYKLSWENNAANPSNFVKYYRVYKKTPGGAYSWVSQLSGAETSLSYTAQDSPTTLVFGISMVTVLDAETSIVPFP